MNFPPEMLERIEKLYEKYEATGQDIISYLDGLLHADYLTYWNYIHLDTLLSLQNPKTRFPDEKIFIMYHQITELYFKMIICELEQVAKEENLTAELFTKRILRVNRYFDNLVQSFEIMVDGMDKEQFLQFRMSLLPASGFQSAQYRMIEIFATDFINLVDKDKREEIGKKDPSIELMYEHIYWKHGATELATGKKTLTLRQFEEKYSETFISLASECIHTNILCRYNELANKGQASSELVEQLRQFDLKVNVNWPLAHYKSAVRYLHRSPEDIKATGGTNWQKYLPPRFQKRIFYPTLWSEEEKANWGRTWVDSLVHE